MTAPLATGKSRRPTAARHLAHLAIRAYQLTLSAALGRHCRYLPTCSHYCDDAIQQHGVWAGGWMGAARICRCHPWGDSGYDPAPETLPPAARWWRPWRYGRWRTGVHDAKIEEALPMPAQKATGVQDGSNDPPHESVLGR